MKKLLTILIVFCTTQLYAQNFSIGATGGEIAYKFRQQQPYSLGVTYFTYGALGQYTFKDSSHYSVEANVFYAPTGLNNSTGYWDPLRSINAAGYFCYTPFKHLKVVMIQLRAGFFYTQYSTPGWQPTNDYGPSIGGYFGCFRITKKSYLGFDFTVNAGLQNYFIPTVLPYETPLVNGNTNILYYNFAIKYIIRIAPKAKAAPTQGEQQN